jgi:hypothetical protein
MAFPLRYAEDVYVPSWRPLFPLLPYKGHWYSPRPSCPLSLCFREKCRLPTSQRRYKCLLSGLCRWIDHTVECLPGNQYFWTRVVIWKAVWWSRIRSITEELSKTTINLSFDSVALKYKGLVSLGGVRVSPLGTSATNWPIVPASDGTWAWSNWWNENWQGKPKYSEKTCPSATLFTTNPTWSGLGSNPGRSLEKPAINGLSYGTANITDWFI